LCPRRGGRLCSKSFATAGLGGKAVIRISHWRYSKTAERLNRQRHDKRRIKSGSDETRTRNPAT
jgi:hypothetical protein